jgi:hypothetical protein
MILFLSVAVAGLLLFRRDVAIDRHAFRGGEGSGGAVKSAAGRHHGLLSRIWKIK